MMKPVAWISESEFSHADTGGEHMLVKVRQAENYTIPLYTAPRELSDEEAIKLWDSIPLVPNEGMTGRLKLFARAILKKAQNK